jgi:NADH-quinone oxidoreductase subunit G
VCPGCERGCAVDLWHRKPDWHLHALDARHNRAIERVTPRDNPAVNGPWICNKGRDLAAIFERPRATASLVGGREVSFEEAVGAARRLIDGARRPVAWVSSWGSNEELQAFKAVFGDRFTCFVKADHRLAAGEVVQDDLLIRADKNPNGFAARALFGDAPGPFAPDTDLVLVWGEGCDFAQLPPGVPVILLNAFQTPDSERAAVFFATSLQTERAGRYTNFEGVVSAFEACFAAPAGVVDAERLFAALATSNALREAVAP